MMPLLLLVCTLPVDKRVCLGHLKVKRLVCMYQPGLTKMDFLQQHRYILKQKHHQA